MIKNNAQMISLLENDFEEKIILSNEDYYPIEIYKIPEKGVGVSAVSSISDSHAHCQPGRLRCTSRVRPAPALTGSM